MHVTVAGLNGMPHVVEISPDCTLRGLRESLLQACGAELGCQVLQDGAELGGEDDTPVSDLQLFDGAHLVLKAATCILPGDGFQVTSKEDALDTLRTSQPGDVLQKAALLGRSPLHTDLAWLSSACGTIPDDRDALLCLLENAGAENIKSSTHFTNLLRRAVHKSERVLVEVLLQVGAEVNPPAAAAGDTAAQLQHAAMPLMTCAVLAGHVPIVGALARAGCAIHRTSPPTGDNVFHVCGKAPAYAQKGIRRMVAILKESYPEEQVEELLSMRNTDLATPVDCAIASKSHSLAECLRYKK